MSLTTVITKAVFPKKLWHQIIGLKNSFFAASFGLLVFSCTPSSDSAFSNLLSNSDGGTGFASIAINSYSPAKASVVVKKENTEIFLVSAVGDGTLTYTWTLDGATVGSNSASFTLDAAAYAVGTKILKVSISDSRGATSQQWSVKVNGTPVINSSTPSVNTVGIRRSTTSSFDVSVSDPNSDSLNYVWKLDGNEGVLTNTNNQASYSPSTSDVGAHTVSVDIYDGDISDSGTYKVTKSWVVNVNNFYSGCNDIDNGSLTNKTCVYAGIADIGEGSNPDSAPTSIFMRPSTLAFASNGNVFIADQDMDIIYYWNKTASAISVVGINVPANSLKKVAGIGIGAATTTTTSNLATRTALNDPQGLYFDGTNLFISDSGNNIVRKVDSSNIITTVLGGGTAHTDGLNAVGSGASAHQCTTPYGITKSGNDLYVACSGNNRVKRVDLTSGLGYVFAGNGGTTAPVSNAASSPTDATNGTLNLPYGLTQDTSGNIYISEYSGCRIRAVNMTGAALTFYGSWTIGSGQMRTIVGSPTANSCSYTSGEGADVSGATNATIHNPRNIDFYNNKLFIAQHSNHSVAVVNFTGSTITYGSTSVPDTYSTRIIGNGTGGFLGDGYVADATRFNTPYDVKANPITNDLLIADYANLRLRTVRASDHKTELTAGNGSIGRFTTAGNAQLEVGAEKMNRPRNIAFDPINGDLYVPDYSNQRIRIINKFGQSSLGAGGSAGAGAEENEYPTNVTLNNPSAVAFYGATTSPAFGGHVIYSDSTNHRIRFWNKGTVTATFFGVSIDPGKVATIAGTGSSGNGTSGAATSAAINSPQGVATDGTNIYFADTGNNCIKKIDSSGVISAAAGTCGASGANANGAVGTAKLNSPQQIAYYENGANKGLFIADTSNSRLKFMRIAGSSAIAGIPVSAGDTNSVICGGTYHDDGIIASNSACSGVYGVTVLGTKVCFTNFNYHNVRCVEITTGIISTAMGPLQGIDDNQPKYFPGTAFSLTDQNNVTAAPGAEPALTDSFGVLFQPLGLASNGTNTLFISEWGSTLIRKVVLP
jgi:hypothetical protein